MHEIRVNVCFTSLINPLKKGQDACVKIWIQIDKVNFGVGCLSCRLNSWRKSTLIHKCAAQKPVAFNQLDIGGK